jgi:sulfide:quinone oxidoreductase
VNQASADPLNVLIAGGGVAGLEAALALRHLAGDAVKITLMAPGEDFVYRPMTVREPFGFSRADRYSLEEIAADLDLRLVSDRLEEVEAEHRRVRTASGGTLSYDALVLALGARLHPRFEHAITIDDRQLDEQLHGLIQDFEGGYTHRLAFVAPAPMPWPLPMYELALMVARRAYDMNADVSVTIVTPEERPLSLFGTTASNAVEALLEENGILTITSAHAEVPEVGRVAIRPGERMIHADRIVALPQLLGPEIKGLPELAPDGFIPVDEHSRVRGLQRVWAAGDATDFPVKFGGVAAQQADAAAGEIAHLAGIPVEPEPFEPEIDAVLLGGRTPLYLHAQLTGGHGMASEVSDTPRFSQQAKISAKYLSPYLEDRVPAAPDDW